MAELHEIEVTAAGWRADKLIAEALPELSRSAVQNLIRDGHVTCDNKIVQKSTKLAPGSVLCVEIPEARPLDVKAENIPLDIVYEDDDLLVVNKPKGMVVHPAAGNYDGTLVNALLYHCGDSLSGINGVIRPGIVHRIDKDTSGLLIVAKNDTAHRHLAEQIKAHSFTREYRAVVYGKIREDGTVDAPIARHPQDRKRMAVQNTPNARNAVTHYFVTKNFTGFTQLRLRLETGRTHQIRVHMAYIGHPVAGDPVYGPKKVITQLHGQCLHAGLIGFIHPRTGEYMEFEAPLFLMACAAVLFCVAFENTPLEPYRVTSTGQSEAASSAPAASALSEEKVNINTASKEELIGLNGIGEVLADRIIEYREANGGYKDVRELTNVKGIGEKLLEKLLPYVTV